MTYITCPCVSCRKEIERPIVVTNFSTMPDKEVYYACPYCLTKLEFQTEEQTETTVDEKLCIEPEQNSENQLTSNVDVHSVRTLVTEKLATLEKERTMLLSELDELRMAANKKITNLEEEVAVLREEKKILEEITSE